MTVTAYGGARASVIAGGGTAPRAGVDVSLSEFGATGTGTPERQRAAIQSALDFVRDQGGGRVRGDPGRVYSLAGDLTTYTGVTFDGLGALLNQMEKTERTIRTPEGTLAERLEVRGWRIAYPTITDPVADRTSHGAVHLVNVADFLVEGVDVLSAAGKGMYIARAERGRVGRSTVADTLADGIHVTNGGGAGHVSRDISIVGNVTRNTGDDSLAVVSYTGAGQAVCEGITMGSNVIDSTQAGGRGLTVAGGRGVAINGNTFRNLSGSAAINLMLDETFNTFAAELCAVIGNAILPALGVASANRHGVRIYRSHGNLVLGNLINWTKGEELYVYGTALDYARDNEIGPNIIRGSRADGLNGIKSLYAEDLRVLGGSVSQMRRRGAYFENSRRVMVRGVTFKEVNGEGGAFDVCNFINCEGAEYDEVVIRQSLGTVQHGMAFSNSTVAPSGRYRAGALTIDAAGGIITGNQVSVFSSGAGAGLTVEQPTARRTSYGTAAPTTGTWAVGDEVKNTAPAVAGGAGSQYVIEGWTCTVAGSPGTWVAKRTLTGT